MEKQILQMEANQKIDHGVSNTRPKKLASHLLSWEFCGARTSRV
jgi:hypothetical protein